MKITKLTNRIMFLSPTVQAGWQSESYRSDFQNLATLGQGSYGTVWKARHKKTNSIYAIKQIKKKSLSSQKMMEHVRNEVKIMYCLNHPNIIKLYNHFEDEFSIYFVLEYAQNGELYKAMLKSTSKKFEEPIAAKYIQQICHALQYIHKQNIIHRDIKPQNILIAKNQELKLADFGWSNFTQGQGKRETYCGTLDYLAPEMVDQSHLHDYRVDIWSIGVLIYELCTGKSPFSSQLIKNNNLSQEGIKINITSLNYQLPNELSLACKDLIAKILVIKPEERLSIEGILAHPWITQIYKQDINEEATIDKWLSKLKHEFGIVMETKEEEQKKYEAFSKEEIYNCSRIESVINVLTKQKTGEQSDRKLKELQLKVKELQLCNCRQEQELKYLRNIKYQHQQCGHEITVLKENNKQQNKRMDLMLSKMQEYERIIREFEKITNR